MSVIALTTSYQAKDRERAGVLRFPCDGPRKCWLVPSEIQPLYRTVGRDGELPGEQM